MEADYPARTEAKSPAHEQKNRNRLLALIAVLLAIWGLKVSAPVTLPLAIATFLIALFWPLEKQLERRVRRWAAITLTLLCFVAIVALLILSLWYAADTVTQRAPYYEAQFNQLLLDIQNIARRLGLSAFIDTSEETVPQPQHSLTSLFIQVVPLVTAFFLILAYLLFGILEAPDYRIKLDKNLGEERGSHWLEIAQKISSDVQRFMIVRGATAVVTSLLVFFFSLLAGLDFAFIWGLITLILEIIPTVGTFISLVLPMLFALFQFGLSGKALLVLLGLGTIQFVMGNFVEPLAEGKYLHLSSLVVLVSIAFWGWIWGIAGAFIAVPLTIMIVAICRQFDQTRWIAMLLASLDVDRQHPPRDPQP